MMCSNWKISVFGIVALMLAFGLATTDALAAKGALNVTYIVAPAGISGQDTTANAAAEVTITFTVNVTGAPDGDEDKDSTFRITIPSVWSRPVNSDDLGTGPDSGFSVGEVFITEAAGITGTVSGRSLVASIGKDAAGTITFVFKTLAPPRAGVYTLPVGTSSVHEGGGNLTVTVGPVIAGSGKVTLTPLKPQPEDDDAVLAYEKIYVLNSEQVLTNLQVRFVAAGTMPKGSTVILTSTSFPAFTRQDNTEVSVSGNIDPPERTAQTVIATVKAGGIQKGAPIVFTIKNYKAPKIAPTTSPDNGDSATATLADTQDWRIKVGTTVAALDLDDDPDTGGDNFEARTELDVGDPFRFVTTKPHGTGKVVLHHAAAPAAFTHIPAETELTDKTLRFTFSELSGIGEGAKFEITIPEPWPVPFVPIGTSEANGALTATPADPGVTVEGRTIKGEFEGEPSSPTGPEITYRVDKAPTAGSYTFPAKASAGHHGTPVAIASPTLEVTAAHGKGTMVLTGSNGRTLSQTTSEAELGNLTFTFTPGGNMAKGAQVRLMANAAWPAFREDNGDGISDAGEVTLRGKATLVVTATHVTATATEALSPSDRLVFTYKKVKAPKTATSASYTFATSSSAFAAGTDDGDGDDNLAALDASPNIGIGRAPDGGGTLSLNVTQADAGSVIGDLMITYTAAGKIEAGSVVEVAIPASGDWPAPNEIGRVALSFGTLTTTETTMTSTTDSDLNTGETIVFTYKTITAPSSGGTYTFTGKSTSSTDGELTSLASGGVTINIDEVAAGTVALNGPEGPIGSAAPGMALGNLLFTFTAGAKMEVASKVTVTIPVAWTPAFLDNNDGVDSPGESSLAGAADFVVSGGGGTPWVLTATTNAILESGDTLMFTYKQVTAPSTEATYQLSVNASTSAAAKLLPVQVQPTIIVRETVTAIAVAADPSSVFTGGEIGLSVTLWAGTAAGRALGGVVIDLDDGDAGGTFTPASITIADAGHEGTATYTNPAAGDYTVTATAGDLEPVTVDVEIKSTIRDLSANGETTEMSLVTQGGTIMVRATGPVGGGTVTVLDEDGQKVGLKKALDPEGAPDADGDQIYARTITLPAVVADGTYTVSVEIQGDVNNSLQVQVVNDQTPPTVSNADASEAVVVNGDTLTLSADVAMNESMVAIASVIADLGGLDSTQATVALDGLSSSPGKYFTIITIKAGNEAEAGNEADDGEYTITITATDTIGNTGSDTVMVTLENDPSELNSAEVTPASGKPGETIWIKATGSEGGSPEATVTNSESGMKIAQVTLEEDADAAGSYSAGLEIVEDAHPVGVYDVTVTLGTKEIPLEGALTIEPAGFEFTLDIPAGRSMIHIPLAVAQVNGVDMEINTVRDVFSALGDAVGFITTLADDGVTFNSYLGDDAPGSAFGDTAIGDDTGLIVNMTSAMTLALKGDALGSGGSATMNLRSGLNLVGVPLQTGILPTLSAAINHPVFAGITHIVIMDENGQFQNVLAGTATDGPLMGGTGYFVIASEALALPVSGVAWENDGGSGSSAAPVALNPTTTSVLHVQGRLIDEVGMMSLDGLNVSFKNLSSGTVLGSTVATDDYSMTFVKIDTTAAKVGDILEINADSGNPLLGIRPVQHVVTAADVLNGSISLPDLVSYEIPAQSELLANYPNPFNPETWIPFRLAEDASVSVTIYGASGSLVRTIDVGFTPAAVYEGRSDAIYWDGRNNFGEQVSSGIYFYHLNAGDFSATRKMVIVK